MRILWVSNSASLGGAELSLAEAVTALAERGHAIDVVLPEEGPLRTRLERASSVHVTWHNSWMTDPGSPLRDRLRWSAYNATQASRELAGIARQAGTDVLVTNTIVSSVGALAARRLKKPHVWFLHEYGTEDHGGAFHFGRGASLAFMRRSTVLFLVNSETLRAHFSRWLPAFRIHRVHYAVDVPDLPAASAQNPGENLRLVFVGRRTPSKGPQDAVRSLARLASQGVRAQLELIGGEDPEFGPQLRQLVQQLGVAGQVRFTDAHEGHFARVAQADVALICSRSEALGRVTIEAMKLGKPVVGAAAGATPELIRDAWNGYLYPPGDSAGMAAAITRLAEDPATAREMGSRGREWAERTFNRDVFGAELEAAFQTAADQSKDGHGVSDEPVPARK